MKDDERSEKSKDAEADAVAERRVLEEAVLGL